MIGFVGRPGEFLGEIFLEGRKGRSSRVLSLTYETMEGTAITVYIMRQVIPLRSSSEKCHRPVSVSLLPNLTKCLCDDSFNTKPFSHVPPDYSLRRLPTSRLFQVCEQLSCLQLQQLSATGP